MSSIGPLFARTRQYDILYSINMPTDSVGLSLDASRLWCVTSGHHLVAELHFCHRREVGSICLIIYHSHARAC